MKTAQDISPSAVLCLALGLYVGNMFMPQQQKFEYVAGWPPTQEATTPDLNEGRSLERLPDNLDGIGKAVQDPESEVIWAAQGNEIGLQELIGLLQRLPIEKPALMSDSAALVMIASFLILGMAASFTDVTELSEDENEEEEEEFGNATQLRILKSAAFCITMVLVSAVGFGSLASSPCPVYSLAPDSCVAVLLGAFIILGLFVMKADIHEMAEEMRSTSSFEIKDTPKVEGSQPAHPSYLRASRLLAVVGVFAAFANIAVAMLSNARAPTCLVVEQASITELQTLAQLFNSSCNVLLDFVLELFLGVCTMIGLAVMRLDVCDMVKQLQDESGRKVTASSPSRLEAK